MNISGRSILTWSRAAIVYWNESPLDGLTLKKYTGTYM
jgi:hypothetical protein